MEKVLICSFKDTLQSIIKLRYLKLETIAKGTLVPEDLHFYVPLRFESCEQRQSALLWFPPCRGRRAPWERAWVGDRGGRSRARIREGAHDRAVSCPPPRSRGAAAPALCCLLEESDALGGAVTLLVCAAEGRLPWWPGSGCLSVVTLSSPGNGWRRCGS